MPKPTISYPDRNQTFSANTLKDTFCLPDVTEPDRYNGGYTRYFLNVKPAHPTEQLRLARGDINYIVNLPA